MFGLHDTGFHQQPGLVADGGDGFMCKVSAQTGGRNHRGNGNKVLTPDAGDASKPRGHAVEFRQLGGLLT